MKSLKFFNTFLQKQSRFSSQYRSIFKSQRLSFSTLQEYFTEFEFLPPFLSGSPNMTQKYVDLLQEIKSNQIPIRDFSELQKLIQIFRRTRLQSVDSYRQIASIINRFLEKKETNIFDFLEIFSIFINEKPDFIPIAKEIFLKSLIDRFSAIEIASFNVNESAMLCHSILIFEVGYKEVYDALQNPFSDSKLDKNVIDILYAKFHSFKKEIKGIDETYLVELLQSYYIILRADMKLPEYKVFFYGLQNIIYKNMKGFTTAQLTTLAILYQVNHIIQKKFWDSLEEEVHFRLNEWNISHLMKVCDCFMSVKEGSLNLFNEIQKYFMSNIECINLEEIPTFLQILIQDEKILDPFLSQLEVKILLNFDVFNVNQLSRIIWCFSLRKQLNHDLYSRIEKKLISNYKELSPFEAVLAIYAMKFSKNDSKLIETMKDRMDEIIDNSNADNEILMGLLYVYSDNLKNEKFFQKLEQYIEIMIKQSTPEVFMHFLRLCIQIHKKKDNLFDESVYEAIKYRFNELEKHIRDDEKMEVKESFKYLNIHYKEE